MTKRNQCRRLCVLLFAISSSYSTVGALPVSQYRERIGEASGVLYMLTGAVLSEESDGQESQASFQTVRELLPPTVVVEWAGGAVHVDNAWLHQALMQIEQLPPTASKEAQVDALLNVAERLRALRQRLAEAESESGLQARNKEEEKARLAAILRRAEYQIDEEGAFSRFLKRLKEWLRSLLPKTQPSELAGGANSLSVFAQAFVIALTLALVAFVGWKLWPLIRNRHRLNKVVPDGARVVLGTQIGANQSAADLLAEAEALARAGDVRGAIRKAYIALLCELGDRKILRLAGGKTNRDYLQAVRPRVALYSVMQPLTVSFERHWYGFEPATETNWKDFLARCRQAFAAAELI